MAIDAQWSSVVLLCPFSSDLWDAKSTTLAPVGNVAISATVGTPFGAGNAAAFDGTGDYIPLLDGSQWAFGTGDFTIEVWVYPTSFPGGGFGNDMALFGSLTGAPFPFFYLNNATGVPTLWDGTTGASASVAVTLNVWNYVVASRVSGVLKIGIGGVERYSGAYTTNFTATTGFAVGGQPGSRSLFGYLGPVRVTKGVGRGVTTLPTAPFPRPTISGTVLDHLAAPVARPVVAVDRKTSQVLSGTISDAITGAYTIYPRTFGEVTVARYDELFDPVTDECLFDLLPIYQRPGPSLVWGVVDTRSHIVSPAGNANFDLSITPFAGLPSISFDGSGDNVNSTSVDYALRTDDLSIEFWYRPINGGHGQAWSRIFQIGANNTNGTVACYCENTNSPSKLFVQFYSGSWITVVSSSAPLSNNTWHAIQIRRIAGVWTMYADEVLQGTSGSTSYDLTQISLYIGSNTWANESFYGNIGPFRIHKGPRRASQVTPLANFLKPLLDGGSGENAAIYDRVIPG